jgi:hypothetical protein|tara:strand:- start:5881 stop:6042 length:162 start_codon:yes stop_codon:yes gene_type:complete
MYLYRGFGEDAAEKCKEYNDNIGFEYSGIYSKYYGGFLLRSTSSRRYMWYLEG